MISKTYLTVQSRGVRAKVKKADRANGSMFEDLTGRKF
jgi:hypothetical protein